MQRGGRSRSRAGRDYPVWWIVAIACGIPAVYAEDAPGDPQTEPPTEPGELTVETERPRSTASSRTLDRDTLDTLPGHSTDDILRAMPGLHASAHGGHGKAYQYFLRGFDAVHGADIAVSLEGVPLNEVSNIHGQGYLDQHFIPEAMVSGVTLVPGCFRAEVGDFGVAGSADFQLSREQPGGTVGLGGGTDRSVHGSVVWRPGAAYPGTFVAADLDRGEGVGMSRSWRQLRVGAGWEAELGGRRFRSFVLGYDGEFLSPGVLREDDWLAGEVGFYDAYPGSGGGASRRVLGAVKLDDRGRLPWQILSYAGWRDLTLIQNFTGYAQDPVHGDGTLQAHRATTLGGRARIGGPGPAGLTLQGGLDGRLDWIQQAEQGVLPDGTPWQTRYEQAFSQADLGLWLSAPWRLHRRLLVEPGVRGELLGVTLDDRAASRTPVLAPKLALTVAPDAALRGYAAAGRGFRSPEARGVEPGEVAPVTRADSVELGVQAEPNGWIHTRAAGFGTWISDELVFDHAAARFEGSGRTRRLGIDAGIELEPRPWLSAQLDLSYSDGRYVVTGEPIPYAPRQLGVGTLALRTGDLGSGPREIRVQAGLRGWALGPRPLPGGFEASPTGALDLTSSIGIERWNIGLDVDNVLGTQWRDGEFLFPSRWDPAGAASELPVRHFTAGSARAAHLSVSRNL